MTHEQRASLIRRLLYLVIAAGVLAGVWFFPTKKPPADPAETKTVVLSLVHHQRQGDPESEKLGAVLDGVQKKYGKQVTLTRVPMTEEEKAKPTYVGMSLGKDEIFRFEGFWERSKVEMKVEEILRGLERVGKDWRPEVKGMKPSGQ